MSKNLKTEGTSTRADVRPQNRASKIQTLESEDQFDLEGQGQGDKFLE